MADAATGDPERAVGNGGPTSPLPRLVIAGLLLIALLASTVWLVQTLRDRDDVAAIDQSTGERDAVLLRATEWMRAFGTYSPDDLNAQNQATGYRKRVEPLVAKGFSCRLQTPQGTAKLTFDQYVQAIGQVIKQSKADLRSSVDRKGVETMDEDSARVIVGGTAEPTRGKQQLPAYTYQMRVDLEKINGSWLVTRCSDIPSRFTS